MNDDTDTVSNIDHVSLATTPVVMVRKGRPLWQGSGFFYVHERDSENRYLFLITSAHVLTGQPPGGKKRSSADDFFFQWHTSVEKPGEVRPVRVPLYTRHGEPVWIEPAEETGADIAAIPVPPNVCDGINVYCLEASWAKGSGISPSILDTVHVVGFPHGYHDEENALPLWQTGTLASEPSQDFNGEERMAVQLPAYPGTAGAPVFMEDQLRPPGAAAQLAQPVAVRRFLGVYASQQINETGCYPEELCTHANPIAVAREAGSLGMVWRASVVEDLVAAIDVERWGREILAHLP